jgi:hypothetical protein
MEKYRKILQKDREEQGDAHELLTSSCDDSRARLVRMAVYGILEVRASEQVSERVFSGGESEHPRLAFYSQRSEVMSLVLSFVPLELLL